MSTFTNPDQEGCSKSGFYLPSNLTVTTEQNLEFVLISSKEYDKITMLKSNSL